MNMLFKIGAVVFMVLVVATECLVASMFLADANETLAEASTAAQGEEAEPDSIEKELNADVSEMVEVDLHEFSVTAATPNSNTTLHIDFHLFGTVHQDDAEDFATLLVENRHRFRDLVLSTVRRSEIPDLADPELALIKRKILTTTNRAFGKHLLKEVMFSRFSYFEQ